MHQFTSNFKNKAVFFPVLIVNTHLSCRKEIPRRIKENSFLLFKMKIQVLWNTDIPMAGYYYFFNDVSKVGTQISFRIFLNTVELRKSFFVFEFCGCNLKIK